MARELKPLPYIKLETLLAQQSPPVKKRRTEDSDTKHPRAQPIAWTEDEHLRFLEGLEKLGKGRWVDMKNEFVTTRTPTQIASHAQKFFARRKGATKRKSKFSEIEEKVLASLAKGRGNTCSLNTQLIESLSERSRTPSSRSASSPSELSSQGHSFSTRPTQSRDIETDLTESCDVKNENEAIDLLLYLAHPMKGDHQAPEISEPEREDDEDAVPTKSDSTSCPRSEMTQPKIVVHHINNSMLRSVEEVEKVQPHRDRPARRACFSGSAFSPYVMFPNGPSNPRTQQ